MLLAQGHSLSIALMHAKVIDGATSWALRRIRDWIDSIHSRMNVRDALSMELVFCRGDPYLFTSFLCDSEGYDFFNDNFFKSLLDNGSINVLDSVLNRTRANYWLDSSTSDRIVNNRFTLCFCDV